MTALWISHVQVTDPDRYAEYAKRATVAIADHGGVFLARGGPYWQKEGADRARNVVVRFPSVDAANDCYESAAYQEALTFAKDASIRELCIVKEID